MFDLYGASSGLNFGLLMQKAGPVSSILAIRWQRVTYMHLLKLRCCATIMSCLVVRLQTILLLW
jgi:hypothetical protein